MVPKFVETIVDASSAFERLYRFLDGRGLKLEPNMSSTERNYQVSFVDIIPLLAIECGLDLFYRDDGGVNFVGFTISCFDEKGYYISELELNYYCHADNIWIVDLTSFDQEVPAELQALVARLGIVDGQELRELEAFEIIGALTNYFMCRRPENGSSRTA